MSLSWVCKVCNHMEAGDYKPTATGNCSHCNGELDAVRRRLQYSEVLATKKGWIGILYIDRWGEGSRLEKVACKPQTERDKAVRFVHEYMKIHFWCDSVSAVSRLLYAEY